jgi:hypothetical protein
MNADNYKNKKDRINRINRIYRFRKKQFPSCRRVSRGFEEHVSEPANASRDAARLAGRGGCEKTQIAPSRRGRRGVVGGHPSALILHPSD